MYFLKMNKKKRIRKERLKNSDKIILYKEKKNNFLKKRYFLCKR